MDTRANNGNGCRSRLVSAIALIFLAFGVGLLWHALSGGAWGPDLISWSPPDVAAQPGGDPVGEEARAAEAEFRAQMRHEVLMKVVMLGWSLLCLAASVGLLLRKNWARVLFISLLMFAVFMQVWLVALFSLLKMTDAWDLLVCLLLVAAFGAIAWKLRAPSVIEEFRVRRS